MCRYQGPWEEGVGGAGDGVPCHVFSSSNHEYPLGRRWADLCTMLHEEL